MRWQAALAPRLGGVLYHIYLDGDGVSQCGNRVLREDREVLDRPSYEGACPRCAKALLARTAPDAAPDLPMEVIAWSLPPRAQRFLSIKHPGATIGEIARMSQAYLLQQVHLGPVTIGSIQRAIRSAGLTLAPDPPSRGARVMKMKSAQAEKEQFHRFVTVFNPDDLQTLSYQEMGRFLGVSRERVRQIFNNNLLLQAIRGRGPRCPSPGSRVKNAHTLLCDCAS